MENKTEELMQALAETGKIYMEALKEIENEQETYWNSLSKDDQIKCFCAVVRRIYKGDIEERGSYRYVLYQVFGFGPEAYAQAQDAGYLTIHNALFDSQEEKEVK